MPTHCLTRCRKKSKKNAGTALCSCNSRSLRAPAGKVGKEILVIIDEVDDEGAIGRSMADAPEIDGAVYLNGESNVKPGDIVRVKVEHADEYDLWEVGFNLTDPASCSPGFPLLLPGNLRPAVLFALIQTFICQHFKPLQIITFVSMRHTNTGA